MNNTCDSELYRFIRYGILYRGGRKNWLSFRFNLLSIFLAHSVSSIHLSNANILLHSPFRILNFYPMCVCDKCVRNL